ncbi:MTX3 protein, partial [Polypterus senegalus]
MSQRLTREERIEIVLMSGELSNRVIAADFNARHPTRPPISHATVSKLLAKFRETGSVLDLPKCGRMKTVTNEETSVAVLASFSKSPQRSTRRMSLESGISRTSLRRILATHKWHPYKLQLLQHLNEDDPDRRTKFAEWAKQKLEQAPQFTQKILFSDEANFYVNEVNKQNHCYWSDINPHWIHPSKTAGTKKLMKYNADYDLSAKQGADTLAFIALLEEKLYPALLHTFWVDAENYSNVTRPWFASRIPFPLNFYLPGRKSSEAVNRILLTQGRPPLYSISEIEAKIYSDAKECLNLLSYRLGSSEYFFGNTPTSLDAFIFGFLGPLHKIHLPSGQLQQHLKQLTNLCHFCDNIISTFFMPNASGHLEVLQVLDDLFPAALLVVAEEPPIWAQQWLQDPLVVSLDPNRAVSKSHGALQESKELLQPGEAAT